MNIALTPISTRRPIAGSATTLSARAVTFIYDGLQRLLWASESSGTTAASTYDALNRTTARGTTTYASNGDGTLASQVTGGVTTRYTQDLVSPLSQVLQTKIGATTATDYLYGLNRLASLNGSTKTWYAADALGSVRRTMADAGTPLGVVNYDPWGTVESGSVPTFGFTGEVQDTASGLVNLRARWYSTGRGTFTSVDPFAGVAETPYSLHSYQYGYSDPVLLSDPSGQVVPVDGPEPSSCRISDPQYLQCILRETQGGAGAQHGQQDNNNHECIGDPEAIEIQWKLGDGSSAPACLDAPQAQLNPWYGQRKAKPPSIWEIITQGCGILFAAPAESGDDDEDESISGGGAQLTPPSGSSSPNDSLKRRPPRDTYYVKDGNYYFKADLDRYGTVRLNVNTKIDGVYGGIHAEEEFNKMLDYFGRSRVRSIRGGWDAEAPGLTDNIELFNKLTAGGMSPEKAAFEIPTGRWAKAAGYDKIQSLQLLPPGATQGHYDLVVVDFGR